MGTRDAVSPIQPNWQHSKQLRGPTMWQSVKHQKGVHAAVGCTAALETQYRCRFRRGDRDDKASCSMNLLQL